MSRLRKSIISICVAVCMCFLSVCSFSINSHAYGETVYLDYSEPSTSDTQGYIVLGVDVNGERNYVTFTWSISLENLTQSTIEQLPMCINIGSTYISFYQNYDPEDNLWITGYLGYYNVDGMFRIRNTWNEDKPATFTHQFSDGITVKSYYVRGAIGNLTSFNSSTYPGSIVFLGDVDGDRLIDYLDGILTSSLSIENKVMNMYATLLPSMNSYLSYMKADLNQLNNFVTIYLGSMYEWVQAIYNLLNGAIKTHLNNINNKLQGIIDYLGVQSAEDKQASDDFAESSSSQSSALNQATQDSQTEKVDADAAAGTIDSTLDFNAVNEYSGVLMVITNNSTVVTMLLIVMCVALISYVLFGKR